MIKEASIQEVMQRADIVDVVGQFVRLKKRGANYLANCPFHNEKTPSFNVNPARGIYKCFGCGKAGNVVTFVQEHEKLSYPEAIRWLADFYKIKIEETERTPEQMQQQAAGESLRVLNEYAATYFHDTLLHTEEGQLIGLSYFKQRGFRNDTIEKFRLGYNPEHNDEFFQTASKKGHQPELMEKAGLAKNRNGSYHDVYRGRVIFPIQNMTGRVIGFGARILKSNDKAPKYINTPETELYIKSKVLYGMYQSRQAIARKEECFLVEGYTDVISLHQGGVENVVASSGTSLTEDQLKLIGQVTKNLTILYDGDSAGIKAALRGLDMALSQSFNVKLVLLPDGEDPDSFIKKSGASVFEEYVKAHKQDVIGFRLEIGMKDVGDDPVKKSKLVNEIAESISRINKAEDFALQSYYIRQASQKLKVDEAGLMNLVNKLIRERVEHDNRQKTGRHEDVLPEPEIIAPTQENTNKASSKEDEQEWQLLKILIEYGHMAYDETTTVAAHIEATLDVSLLKQPLVLRLIREYYEHYQKFRQTPEMHYFINYHDPEIQHRMATLLHKNAEINPKWHTKTGLAPINENISFINDVDSSLVYFQFKKLLNMQQILLNDKLKNETDPFRQDFMMKTFLRFKELERELIKKHGTVVYRSIKSNL